MTITFVVVLQAWAAMATIAFVFIIVAVVVLLSGINRVVGITDVSFFPVIIFIVAAAFPIIGIQLKHFCMHSTAFGRKTYKPSSSYIWGFGDLGIAIGMCGGVEVEFEFLELGVIFLFFFHLFLFFF